MLSRNRQLEYRLTDSMPALRLLLSPSQDLRMLLHSGPVLLLVLEYRRIAEPHGLY
jgi:hypothetical protein